MSQPQPIKINEDMLRYMKDILHKKKVTDDLINSLFNPSRLEFINKDVRNGDYYALDIYGLPVRKKAYNTKKSAFGWTYEDGELINIHVNELQHKTNSDETQRITLQHLKYKFPKLFQPPRGVIYRIYSSVSCDVLTL